MTSTTTSDVNGDTHVCCSDGIESFLSSSTLDSTIEAVSKLFTILEVRFQFAEITPEQKNKVADKIARNLTEESLNSAERCKFVQLVRIISRDKSGIDSFATDALLHALLISAGLKNALRLDEIESKIEEHTQALKSLCNLIFNSTRAREKVGKADIYENLLNRIQTGATLNLPFVLRCFDMRLSFLLSALDPQLRKVLRVQYGGIDALTTVLDGCLAKYDENRGFIDEDVDLMCESLKTLFNLCSTIDRDGQVYEANEIEKLEHLGEVVRRLLLAKCETAAKRIELQSNSLNLMTGMPVSIYKQLLTPVDESQPKRLKTEAIPYYDGYDMRAIDSLINFLEYHIDKEQKPSSDSIIPVLTLLLGLVQNERPIRKYLRFKILPPLSDFMERPEIGNSVRNKLCRLMTHSSIEVKHAAANFLYEICKKSVDRLIKYTGFGNAAGLLADFGLFAPRAKRADESDSEDSDTEEYLKVKDQINPVTGCVELPRPNPLEGMSEEQKEYEVMRIVNQLDRMTRSGVIRPGRIDETGRVVPVEHVLELQQDGLDPTRAQRNDERNSSDEED